MSMARIGTSKMSLPVLLAWLLVPLALLGCTGQQAPTAGEPIIRDVTAQEASALIMENQNDPDFVIIDCRTPEEYAGGHIEDSVNIDYRSDAFSDELEKLDRDRTYLIYCRSGGRSGEALDVMAGRDFAEVYNLEGGILGWEAADLPTIK
jgi:rhodanese-related sulfurtransferase